MGCYGPGRVITTCVVPPRTIYHQGSADLLDDERIPCGVDIFLCGIAGRMFTHRYVKRIVSRLEPRVVVPHHWDDFFVPLDGPLGFSLNVRLTASPTRWPQ
jgi:L-ascorbate metabolism protein UlaG (beta-lactamase superfamily)